MRQARPKPSPYCSKPGTWFGCAAIAATRSFPVLASPAKAHSVLTSYCCLSLKSSLVLEAAANGWAVRGG